MEHKAEKPAKPRVPAAMHAVNSSSIQALGHENDTLFVQFKSSGKTYFYPGVPFEEFSKLKEAKSIGAKSIGALFSQTIRLKIKGEPCE